MVRDIPDGPAHQQIAIAPQLAQGGRRQVAARQQRTKGLREGLPGGRNKMSSISNARHDGQRRISIRGAEVAVGAVAAGRGIE